MIAAGPLQVDDHGTPETTGPSAAPARESLPSLERLEGEALAFKALGHPTRLLMVRALAQGELCVCDLQRLAGVDMSTVSRHLLQLKTAGVLASRRRRNQVLYRLRTPCVVTVMECVAGVIGSGADLPPSAAGDDDSACSLCETDRHAEKRRAAGRRAAGVGTGDPRKEGRT